MNTQNVCPPCPQCGATDAHMMLLVSDRHQCRCRACGFVWTDPPALRPVKDRRRSPPTEMPD